jgi:hypothetical protein
MNQATPAHTATIQHQAEEELRAYVNASRERDGMLHEAARRIRALWAELTPQSQCVPSVGDIANLIGAYGATQTESCLRVARFQVNPARLKDPNAFVRFVGCILERRAEKRAC